MSDVLDPSSGLDADGNPVSPDGNSGGITPDAKGRTLDNVRGELLRKQDEMREQLALLSDGFTRLTEALASRPAAPAAPPRPLAPPPVSPYGAPSPGLTEYTDEQLQTALASGSLSQYQRSVIESTLADRRIERRTTELFTAKQREADVSRLKAEAELSAKSAFPALRDGSSEFSKRVAAELKKQRESFGEFPTDTFDVANRVARQMGVEVSRTAKGFVGNTDGPAAPITPDNQLSIDDDELKRIAEKLQFAMPLKRDKDGRMVRKQFNLQRVKERVKTYDENSQFYRGRKIGGK